MTTYIVNGNAANLDKILKGCIPADNPDISFIIVTHSKCPEFNRKIISSYSGKSGSIEVLRIKHGKNAFKEYVKGIYQELVEKGSLVIMPELSLRDEQFLRYLDDGRVSVRSRFLQERELVKGGKLTILIDYENVGNYGLQRAEYLCVNDEVVIFYSARCHFLRKRHFNTLSTKPARFQGVKLKNEGRNAMDFYIALHVGQMIANGSGKVLIVSGDKDFGAVRDYCEGYGMTVAVAKSIEEGIVLIDGDTERKKMIEGQRERVDLDRVLATA